jgi:hypothetical protein
MYEGAVKKREEWLMPQKKKKDRKFPHMRTRCIQDQIGKSKQKENG